MEDLKSRTVADNNPDLWVEFSVSAAAVKYFLEHDGTKDELEHEIEMMVSGLKEDLNKMAEALATK